MTDQTQVVRAMLAPAKVYDNVHYRDAPEAWNMRLMLSVSSVLGVFGVISALGLFYLAERVIHLDRAR